MTPRQARGTEQPDRKRNALAALGLEPGDRLEIPAFGAPLGQKAFAESQRRLFGAEIDGTYGMPSWPVAVNYVIRDGLILPAEVSGQPADTLADALTRARASDDGVVRQRGARSMKSPYFPMSRPELPSELAKVAGGKESEVLAFARRYGLLGYALGLSDLERAALALAKQSTTPVLGLGFPIDRAYDPELPGDPVSWFLAHAENVKFVGELAAALRTPHSVRPLLERRMVEHEGREVISYTAAERGWSRPRQTFLPVVSSSWEATAYGIVAVILNRNLGGMRRALVGPGEVGSDGPLVSVFPPRNLLDSIYWMLADDVVGSRIRSCPECGHFFVAADERMKYCPPPMGVESVSPCMNQAKVRRWHEKHPTTSKKHPRRKR